ncbi:unnamed protein product [Blepharisma stoltei]|uniref:TPX2 central domain-containing protein n=1 Tax=Blepharisma stoltei TaxID=1481888 RepID=A0AAU9IUV8_9CILI|nr:unnamed protein product [Blepharisma stoltei]
MSKTFTPSSNFTPKMISRIGKNSADRFMILGQREEIIKGKTLKRKFRFSSVEEEDEPKEAVVISELIKKEEMIQAAAEENYPKAAKLSSFFKAQTRDDYYKHTFGKNCAPPCGHYNPNFEVTRKHIQSPRLTKAKIERRPTTEAEKEFRFKRKIENNDYHSAHLQSAIPFNKQLDRGLFYNLSVNEKRFIQQNLSPEVCTKFKKVKVPDLSKQLSRKDFHTVSDCSPEYEANKEPFLRKLVKSISLEKSIGRKSENLRHIPDPYDVKYDLVTHRPLKLDFTKYSSREKYMNCPFPSFMQGLNSRISLSTPAGSVFSPHTSQMDFWN